MGITVLKDHTSWQIFMPLPANSLMQSSQHITAYVHIHFWISKYEYNSGNSCSIQYRCNSLPAYWHTLHFVVSQWRWTCPLHYSSFWVKCWIHFSRHHRIGEPICSSFKWLKKWKSTCKHKFLWTSITFLGTHHAHTLLYVSCTWTMLDTVFTNHSSALDKSWIVSWWFHHLRCVHIFLICQSERCNLHDGCQPTLELSAPSL